MPDILHENSKLIPNIGAKMTTDDLVWQPARLFPITGIGGIDEQERRGCSAFLAVVQSVREFGRALTSRCGAPSGTISTFIEVPFDLNGKTLRPDGLIRVMRGQRSWTALVEVKTGKNDLNAEQISNYLDIAREQGFDAVITISHEVATTPGVHPVVVDKRKLKKVALFHLSWSRILTEARIEQASNAISDPDQSWILSEFVRYLENPKSGAWDFDDMGPSWTQVRDQAILQTLRPTASETLEVVSKFDQLIAYSAMRLSRELGVNVQQYLSKKDRADHLIRLQTQAASLVKAGQLKGSLVVPNAASTLDINMDLRANRIDCSTTLQAPSEGRASTRINWLIRQLKDAPDSLLIKAVGSRAVFGPSQPLSAVRSDPTCLLFPGMPEIKSFSLLLTKPAGSKSGKGRSSFVASVTDLVDEFYAGVMQYLKVWTPPPPKPIQKIEGDAQEVLVTGISVPDIDAPEEPQRWSVVERGLLEPPVPQDRDDYFS
jgi:hypothetical protein